jgi:hypothetical protein
MTVRAPQGLVVGSPPRGNYVAVQRDPLREPVTQHQDPSYRGPDQVPTSYASDRNTRRRPEQAISANEQANTARDAYGPAQYALPSRISRLCTSFVSIGMGNYSRLSLFILENKEIVSQSEIDSLISSAREEQHLGHESNAQTYVHHALLLRRCKELDDKERRILFKRLDDKNSETRRDFLGFVRTVHTGIKDSARTSSQIPQNTDIRSQGRRPATTIQSDDPRVRPAQDESNVPDVRPPMHRVQTRDGRQVYVDELGHPLQAAPARHEPTRSGARDGANEVSDRMARMSMAETTPHDGRTRDTRPVGSEDPTRHVEGANLAQNASPLDRRTSVLYGTPMPTLPEDRVGGGREFKGTEGDTETLDPRTYPKSPLWAICLTIQGYQKRQDAKNFFTRGRVSISVQDGLPLLLTNMLH